MIVLVPDHFLSIYFARARFKFQDAVDKRKLLTRKVLSRVYRRTKLVPSYLIRSMRPRCFGRN